MTNRTILDVQELFLFVTKTNEEVLEEFKTLKDKSVSSDTLEKDHQVHQKRITEMDSMIGILKDNIKKQNDTFYHYRNNDKIKHQVLEHLVSTKVSIPEIEIFGNNVVNCVNDLLKEQKKEVEDILSEKLKFLEELSTDVEYLKKLKKEIETFQKGVFYEFSELNKKVSFLKLDISSMEDKLKEHIHKSSPVVINVENPLFKFEKQTIIGDIYPVWNPYCYRYKTNNKWYCVGGGRGDHVGSNNLYEFELIDDKVNITQIVPNGVSIRKMMGHTCSLLPRVGILCNLGCDVREGDSGSTGYAYSQQMYLLTFLVVLHIFFQYVLAKTLKTTV